MTWENIFKFIVGAIGSVGGVGGVLLLLFKFFSPIIVDSFQKQYQLKLDKDLEIHKSKLGKKTYISKARFDTEFQIYKELSQPVLSMVDATCLLFTEALIIPIDGFWTKDIYKERYEDAKSKIEIALEAVNANAPFIPKKSYEEFHDLCTLCLKQKNLYKFYGDLASPTITPDDKQDVLKKCYKRTDEIKDKKDELIDYLRNYLSELEIAKE